MSHTITGVIVLLALLGMAAAAWRLEDIRQEQKKRERER